MTALTRTIDLETSMAYRWADAGQIVRDLQDMSREKLTNRSEYPELIARLVSVKCDIKATLALIENALQLCSKQLGVEDARAVDILAGGDQ